jgi:hypothetical protein
VRLRVHQPKASAKLFSQGLRIKSAPDGMSQPERQDLHDSQDEQDFFRPVNPANLVNPVVLASSDSMYPAFLAAAGD